MKIKIFLIFSILLFSSLSSSGQTNSTISQDKQIEFEIMIPKLIVPKVKQNETILNIEEMLFLSSDNVKVFLTIEYYKTRKDVENALKEIVKKSSGCQQKGEVTDIEGEKLGKRYICQAINQSKEQVNIIIYNYGVDLFELRSSSLKHLEIFEAESCPRSNLIEGRKCPENYLKKNWVKERTNRKIR